MPRGPRLDAPGLVHHVWQRGLDRRPIFRSPEDCEFFLWRLSLLLAEEDCTCLAHALMVNHFHLVVRRGRKSLAGLMARLGTIYGLYFNRTYGHVGHVFQNRFKSRPVEDDGSLMALVVYVHANPLVAGMVDDERELRTYPWCTHGAALGERAPRGFEAIDQTLGLFGKNRAPARERLAALVVERVEAERRNAAFLSADATERALREICDRRGVAWSAIQGSRLPRHDLAARRSIVRLAVDQGWTARGLARALGLAPSTITRDLGATCERNTLLR